MKVSIITVCYNSAETIEGAIKSVLGQSYPDIEYIVIDGASTDGTLEILGKYKNKIAKIVSEKDSGIYEAMNKGIALATGDIVGILNSDDFYYDNDVVKTVVENIVKNDADACWGDLVYVKKDDTNKVVRFWKSSEYKPGKFIRGWHPPHPTFFVKRELYQKYGVFRLDLSVYADYELMLRFLEKYKIKGFYIPKVFIKMREGGASNWRSIKKVFRGSMENYKAFKMNGLKFGFIAVVVKPLSKITQIFSK
ncbi:MAG: glycosyltransferase family 2 protein [Candidatus Paceibacterota bacterium]